MTVLQLPAASAANPNEGGDVDVEVDAPSAAASRAMAIDAASSHRGTPSPVKSLGSLAYVSTTPVTSNRAHWGTARGGAASNFGPAANSAAMVHPDGNDFRAPYPLQQPMSAATLPQRPASFLPLNAAQPPGGATMYPPVDVSAGAYVNNVNASVMTQPQRMQPRAANNPPLAANGFNPPWNRMGGGSRGMPFAAPGGAMSNNRLATVTVGGVAPAAGNMNRASVQSMGRLASNQSGNLLGNVQSAARLGDGGVFGSRGRLAAAPTANPYGTVTVGGAPAANLNPSANLLGPVTVGGGAPAPNATLNRGTGAIVAGGGRFGGPPPARPPLLPPPMPPTPIAKHVEFVDASDVGAEFGPEAPSFVAGVQEATLTSDLVTLSVHEALTFDGVELALHPDVLGKSAGKNGDKKAPRLRPGDLVEIRVWSTRPGVSLESSSHASASNSKAGSAMKSKLQTGPRPSMHSRNTSLATVSSSLTGVSLMATPRPLTTKGGLMALPQQPVPPLPKVVGGQDLSSVGVSPEPSGELFGENLVQLDTPAGQAPETNAPNISSVLSGAASNLFRRVAEGGTSHGETSDSSSALAHSRDSSLVTTSTVGEMHSRDSSLLTTSASWMNALNGMTSKDGTPQISPTIGVMDPVSEGGSLPQPHPLTSNSVTASPESQVLPFRRDTSPLKGAPPTAGPPPPLPPPPPPPLHPLSSSTPLAAQASGSSTPSHAPSSPTASTPASTPPVVNAMAVASATLQRPPMMPPSADPSPTSSPVRQAGTVLSPENKSPSDPRQRASTADAPGSETSHSRNPSTSTTGTLTAGNASVSIPTHRRNRSSNATAASDALQSAQLVPSSQRRSSACFDSDAVRDIHEMLQGTHFVRILLVMPVSEGSLSSIKSGARTQVSLLRQVADLYNITAYDTVTVTRVPGSQAPFAQQSISADFLTVTFKDQFVSRGDMYNFAKHMLRDWVYEGKRLTFNGIRTNTKVIRHGDRVVRSGLISEDTKLTFRSRSARIIWLVQMSSEMWEFASPFNNSGNHHHESSCKLYFDKFVEFARRLFDKWKRLQLTHNLTVIFFSRTYLRHREGETGDSRARQSSAVHVDSDARVFEDHYKIVVENETGLSSWDSLIHRMKKEFVSFPKGVGWDLTSGKERTPSTASQGNILEAINITLNLLHLHYIDRDLHRTGNSIVIFTPGSGVFEIDKNLAGITKQRMMDNGIGSDMLSLGLPPLHVAPFFLFKEKSTSTAEEIQGFDEYKTYFEVPHWMNLSFVDYDNESKEPVLWESQYKEDLDLDEDAINANGLQGESEPLAQSWRASNGFLKRQSPNLIAPKVTPDPANLAKQHYKHLISGRGFEDILQACRPRNRGDFGSGLPVSLTVLLQKAKPATAIDSKDTADWRAKTAGGDGDSRQLALTPQRSTHASRSRYLEWGAVDFDTFTHRRRNNALHTQNIARSLSDSQSSPASSFASGSYKLPSQFLGSSHLQSTTSLEGGQSMSSGGGEHATATMHKKGNSDGSLAALDNEEGTHELSSSKRVSSLLQLMAEHDKGTFSSTPKASVSKDNGLTESPGGSQRNSFNDSFGPESPREQSGILRAQSAVFSAHHKGGIEAALVQYDVTKQTKESGPNRRDHLVNSEVAVRPSLATSPLSIGMPFSLDRRSERLRPSTMRLIAPGLPDVIPQASKIMGNDVEGFQPLQTRRDSIVKIKAKDGSYHQSKMIAITKADRRHSQLEMWKENESKKGSNHRLHSTASGATGGHRHQNQTASSHKKKPHSRKSHHRHYRHRRKPWVLNPFRQEDEDEVLAKRTHNRRRWSHVFPLGEDEFKRHAGPNWKSLCQPAILPMTIDFHPPQQELEDIKKFSVKNYSVTLPPIGESTYDTHAELLGDLLSQRMRQDFQIVPQHIIQQSARRDGTGTQLEATLSMGHKIQRLSYNPSTDSVDVVQYYARFAEDETPQTYRYLLWSTLRQDYVSVFQTFTKYTLPYKWNELDMLISGDAVTTIHEGMRYPRLCFVIIPDTFSDAQGEQEYAKKFERLVEYFVKLQPKDEAKSISIEMHTSSDAYPRASSGDKRFIVDLRKKRDDKYEWMELVHDGNCDTRRTFRMTIQWLVAVASKIDQQAQLLHRRCTQYGLKLVSVPHFSCLRSCFLNPFAVPLTTAVRNKACVDAIEKALTDVFGFVYDGTHMSDPNEIDDLDGFEFVVNKWSIKKKKKFVPARQYLHRSGTLFTRLLRDTKGSAIVIIYLNRRHISGDAQRLQSARMLFRSVEKFIADALCNIA